MATICTSERETRTIEVTTKASRFAPEVVVPQGEAQYPERYRFRSHVASGGMGKVDLVHDTTVGRTTAIKTILPDAIGGDVERRFVNEARILGRLEHPNIVPLYDMGADHDEDAFFTMRFIRGQTLSEIIDRLGTGCRFTMETYTWARRVHLIQQLCDAIEYAHSRGIVHCDLKPDNIMVGSFGELVVMDWGIAVELDAGHAESSASGVITADTPDEELPKIVGSPAYLSPEVVTLVEPFSRARDIFAIGAIAYELFGLERPFERATVDETLTSVRDYTPPPLYTIRKMGQRTVPVELHYVCARALQKDPAKRYQRCDEMRQHLQLYLDGRFPIRCASTALKRFSQKVTHVIDDHPKASVCSVALIGLAATSGALAAVL